MKNTGIGIRRIGAAMLAALMLVGCSGTNPETYTIATFAYLVSVSLSFYTREPSILFTTVSR